MGWEYNWYEIRVYIKVCKIIDFFFMLIFINLMEGYWFDKVFSEIVGIWKKKFLLKFGWFMIVICKVNILNIKEIMKSDCWYLMCDIVFYFKVFFKRMKDIW